MMNKNKAGLVAGILVALMHAAWALVVALGIGQVYLDWIFPLHFIDSIYTVNSFSFGTALLLIVLAFIGGYVMGWIFALIVNLVYKK